MTDTKIIRGGNTVLRFKRERKESTGCSTQVFKLNYEKDELVQVYPKTDKGES